ncbi:predicted protein [Pyrenophora tritici-repentis Pt-1C-BFP]|uniref:Uncharacterized protein n=1 Tax=Pyrenophora tritici-repentis (strain Pt-1C-BFP) TaxID=426418 RepID=B2WBP9_PYRTR|nr:uncharacterized protein PTRG_07062 [Pyrenophora tritici-repentis Pt-1C-BFP]EDU49981.1 predicted protein [Pyrenophora tritici-repentis Pt-1C-BFP]
MVNELRARLADEQLHGVIGANNCLSEAGRTPTKSMVIGTPADRLLGVCLPWPSAPLPARRQRALEPPVHQRSYRSDELDALAHTALLIPFLAREPVRWFLFLPMPHQLGCRIWRVQQAIKHFCPFQLHRCAVDGPSAFVLYGIWRRCAQSW